MSAISDLAECSNSGSRNPLPESVSLSRDGKSLTTSSNLQPNVWSLHSTRMERQMRTYVYVNSITIADNSGYSTNAAFIPTV